MEWIELFLNFDNIKIASVTGLIISAIAMTIYRVHSQKSNRKNLELLFLRMERLFVALKGIQNNQNAIYPHLQKVQAKINEFIENEADQYIELFNSLIGDFEVLRNRMSQVDTKISNFSILINNFDATHIKNKIVKSLLTLGKQFIELEAFDFNFSVVEELDKEFRVQERNLRIKQMRLKEEEQKLSEVTTTLRDKAQAFNNGKIALFERQKEESYEQLKNVLRDLNVNMQDLQLFLKLREDKMQSILSQIELIQSGFSKSIVRRVNLEKHEEIKSRAVARLDANDDKEAQEKITGFFQL